MLRSVVLEALQRPAVRLPVVSAATSSGLVSRFVGGADLTGAVQVASRLVDQGMGVSLDRLGEDVTSPGQTTETVAAYEELFRAVSRAGLGEWVEASVKPTALGISVPGAGPELFRVNLHRLAAAAAAVGVGLTVDMEGRRLAPAALAELIAHAGA